MNQQLSAKFTALFTLIFKKEDRLFDQLDLSQRKKLSDSIKLKFQQTFSTLQPVTQPATQPASKAKNILLLYINSLVEDPKKYFKFYFDVANTCKDLQDLLCSNIPDFIQKLNAQKKVIVDDEWLLKLFKSND